jgi:hypothetical protein
MQIASIGIDLGKTTFHLVAFGERNKISLRKKFSRSQLLAYTANLPSSLIGPTRRASSSKRGSERRAERRALFESFGSGRPPGAPLAGDRARRAESTRTPAPRKLSGGRL